MAKHITDIFKNNSELLENKEVKELIKQFKIQFYSLKKEKDNYKDKVTDILMSTDFFVINGLKSDDAIKKLLEISF